MITTIAITIITVFPIVEIITEITIIGGIFVKTITIF